MLKWIKEFFFGRYVSEEEINENRAFRKRARMHMLGAAGGSIKPDDDGVVRIREIKSGENRTDGEP
jgi:hypothetical protein